MKNLSLAHLTHQPPSTKKQKRQKQKKKSKKAEKPIVKRDALIIYGGKEIARLGKNLPDPEAEEDVFMRTANQAQ